MQVRPPGEAVAVYRVIRGPPSTSGGSQETRTDESKPVPSTSVGAPGAIAEAWTPPGDAVADVYASFHDATLGSYGEVREWVEGRTWSLECDARLRARRR